MEYKHFKTEKELEDFLKELTIEHDVSYEIYKEEVGQFLLKYQLEDYGLEDDEI